MNAANPFAVMIQLQQATLACRKRTGDKHIGTRVEAGKIQVVRAVPPVDAEFNGEVFDVLPLTGWMTPAEAVHALRVL